MRPGQLNRIRCEFHAKMAEAIASADEISAKKASDNLIDYVEQYTRRTLDALCVA
jgi:DNA-binding FadR family transcriptional regulator